ncbi:MAG: PA0069 family radical SAM protein [Myxococcales bacterium]|nr:PA0069 family radical SAM protein [Myxococcales bacterium]
MRVLRLDNPPNRFEREVVEYFGEAPRVELELYEDQSQRILSENDSPDLPFRYSLNPYRGCFHGCAYCYARPSHEYLGFGAGTDFERRIVVKPRAPELLRAAFDKKSWQGELVIVSGNTDAYQLVETSHRLTRACLEVFAEYRNPVHVITKSPLIERDLDVFARLLQVTDVSVSVSIPFWDKTSARALEPYVASPERRMQTVRRLSQIGVPVCVNVAPIVPGLGDRDLPRVLAEARDAGARAASMIMLRLPGPVQQVFEERLRATLPLAAERVLARTREMRAGRLNDPRFGDRMRGSGHYAEAIQRLFETTAERLGLATGHSLPAPDPRPTFRRPTDRGGQLRLFD